jgi:cytochrome c-550 PedF
MFISAGLQSAAVMPGQVKNAAMHHEMSESVLQKRTAVATRKNGTGIALSARDAIGPLCGTKDRITSTTSFGGTIYMKMRKSVLCLLTAGLLASASGFALSHGDVTPQPVDTKGLPDLGTEWKKSNPYRDNALAIKIGASAYNQNCARCHGLEAISGGIAPDLRYLPEGTEGDEIFVMRVTHGAVRDGRVYMPKFEGILSQEALWTIRAWLESVREK